MQSSGVHGRLDSHSGLDSFAVEVPSGVGLYWVWQPTGCFQCLGKTHLVEVSRLEAGELMVSMPGCSYRDALKEIARIVEPDGPWYGAMWLGPVIPPQVHVDDSGVTAAREMAAPALERAWEALPLAWRAHPALKALIHAARRDIEDARKQGASAIRG